MKLEIFCNDHLKMAVANYATEGIMDEAKKFIKSKRKGLSFWIKCNPWRGLMFKFLCHVPVFSILELSYHTIELYSTFSFILLQMSYKYISTIYSEHFNWPANTSWCEDEHFRGKLTWKRNSLTGCDHSIMCRPRALLTRGEMRKRVSLNSFSTKRKKREKVFSMSRI